ARRQVEAGCGTSEGRAEVDWQVAPGIWGSPIEQAGIDRRECLRLVVRAVERRVAGRHVGIIAGEGCARGVRERQRVTQEIERLDGPVRALLEHLAVEDLDAPTEQLEIV